MTYLLDTNIISEIRKGPDCHPSVRAWFTSISDDEIFISAIALGEIRRGIEKIRAKSRQKAESLEAWLSEIFDRYEDNILPVDHRVADTWGRMTSQRTVATLDGLMAATAKAYELTFVTRNISDVADLDVALLNPFEV